MSSTEQQRTYEAEYFVRDVLKTGHVILHGARFDLGVERNFANLDSVQSYVNAVLALNWVHMEYPQAASPLRVERHRAINYADCGGGVMRVNDSFQGKWALREIVILHELAHHLSPGGHDTAFRTCLAHLVEEIISPETGLTLRTAYWDQGLSVLSAPSMVG